MFYPGGIWRSLYRKAWLNMDLIGMTRGHAMRLAVELSISGDVECVAELLMLAQWGALVVVHGVPEATHLVSQLHADDA